MIRKERVVGTWTDRPGRYINEALFDGVFHRSTVCSVHKMFSLYLHCVETSTLFSVFVIQSEHGAHLIWPQDQFVYQYSENMSDR